MSQGSDDLRAQRLRAFDTFLAGAASPLQQPGAAGGLPEAWFLGPKAENDDVLLSLIVQAVAQHCAFRRGFHPEDPVHITNAIKQSPEYRDAIAHLNAQALTLFEKLRHSAPLFSMRYQSHMLWDQALPAVVGYIGALLYNQNNVAAEASPVTTWLEIAVGNDLCRMLGFTVPPAEPPEDTIVPWGHITCDGSVANIEGLWAARNAKFFALALREALHKNNELKPAKHLEVRLLDGTMRRLIDINDPWMLLNLPIDSVVNLPHAIKKQYDIDPAITTGALQPYAVQNIGLIEFYGKFLPGIKPPVVMAPATRHYSWPKAVTLLGLGQNSLVSIPVDLQARMDVAELKKELETSVADKQPVIAVVAVIGSTEESAVDPLRAIIDLRAEFRNKGLDFAVHCDAAWGGYFNTIRKRPVGAASLPSAPKPAAVIPAALHAQRLHFLARFEQLLAEIPSLPMSPYVNDQYAAMAGADSITVDPHKAGYAPYPAGSVCYRNSAMRDLISLKAPVVFHSALEPTVGIYGVEGSKPGAAAAAARGLFRGLGSDQVILAYSFNFKNKADQWNTDPGELAKLNNEIFKICSIMDPKQDVNSTPLILTSSDFDVASYGARFIQHYSRRLGIDNPGNATIPFLISTTMDPWTTDTAGGDFLQVVEDALRSVAYQAMDALNF